MQPALVDAWMQESLVRLNFQETLVCEAWCTLLAISLFTKVSPALVVEERAEAVDAVNKLDMSVTFGTILRHWHVFLFALHAIACRTPSLPLTF